MRLQAVYAAAAAVLGPFLADDLFAPFGAGDRAFETASPMTSRSKCVHCASPPLLRHRSTSLWLLCEHVNPPRKV